MKYSKIQATRPIHILSFDGGLTINYGKSYVRYNRFSDFFNFTCSEKYPAYTAFFSWNMRFQILNRYLNISLK